MGQVCAEALSANTSKPSDVANASTQRPVTGMRKGMVDSPGRGMPPCPASGELRLDIWQRMCPNQFSANCLKRLALAPLHLSLHSQCFAVQFAFTHGIANKRDFEHYMKPPGLECPQLDGATSICHGESTGPVENMVPDGGVHGCRTALTSTPRGWAHEAPLMRPTCPAIGGPNIDTSCRVVPQPPSDAKRYTVKQERDARGAL